MTHASANEVTVVISDGTTYTLAMTLNGMAALQKEFGVSWEEVAAEAEKGSPTHIRSLLWTSLNKRHKDLTLEQFGDIDLVDARKMGTALLQLLQKLQPDPRDVAELSGGKKRPRRAQTDGRNGTGARSS